MVCRRNECSKSGIDKIALSEVTYAKCSATTKINLFLRVKMRCWLLTFNVTVLFLVSDVILLEQEAGGCSVPVMCG